MAIACIASKSDGEALLLTRNGNDYTGVFPESRARSRRFRSTSSSSTEKSSSSTRRGNRAFPASNGAAGFVRRRYPARCCRASGDVLRFRLARLRGSRFPPAAARRAQGAARAARAEARSRCASSITSIARARRFSSRSSAHRARGNHCQEGGRAVSRRSLGHWLKIKAEPTGRLRHRRFTAPQRPRGSLGALQLADCVNGELVYAGRVGTGFN